MVKNDAEAPAEAPDAEAPPTRLGVTSIGAGADEVLVRVVGDEATISDTDGVTLARVTLPKTRQGPALQAALDKVRAARAERAAAKTTAETATKSRAAQILGGLK